MSYPYVIEKPVAGYVAKAGRTEIDEFIDNKDGTSTLLITCASGKRIIFTLPSKKLKETDIDSLYKTIDEECAKNDT